MNWLKVRFRIVTPLFLAGANPNRAELRGTALKGALRFWYRAVDPEYRNHEPFLFGSADEKYSGQSKILMRLEPGNLRHSIWKREDAIIAPVRENGLSYLAFSLSGGRVKSDRAYLCPGQSFDVYFLIRPREDGTKDLDESDRRRLLAALWFLGHVGGLGTRARRGFGTIAMTDWELNGTIWDELKELPIAHRVREREEWIQLFQKGLKKIFEWFPPESRKVVEHTVVDRQSSFLLASKPSRSTKYSGRTFAPWATALNLAGLEFKSIRTQKSIEERAAFGLPIVGSEVRPVWMPEQLPERVGNRMGSSVWIRVIELGDVCFPLYAFLSSPFPVGLKKGSLENVPFRGTELLEEFRDALRRKGYREVTV